MLSGTASTHVGRLARDAARTAGVPAPLLAGLPGADDAAHTTVYEGLEQAPEALLGVLGRANTGKMLVRLG